MSRHYFNTEYQGNAITVLIGYDRPLGGFFMVIENASQEEDLYIYSNLYEQVTHPKSLEPYKSKLDQLGIFVPVEMLLEVEADGAALMGNKDVHHSIENGTHRRIVG
ncbi:hypothetical protein [Pseudoalteromonas luteoviolacea]|uniref:hypothetical protein n=1 Tax=Pseudoalteromonas luteoviolacea TaxID=43657 RepID=UPI001B37715B|nr:hypothetical protein [Pseudoalteromonas luteoviolacea]MBQ4840015.1 hypothetical protein [Pseudoalteromonas luteoviolacea]